jgi:hypothetical protein
MHMALLPLMRLYTTGQQPSPPLADIITFGDVASEAAHGLTGSGGSAAETGGLRGQSFRSLPLNASLRFTLAVEMDAPAQYLTVQVSGEEWRNSSDIRACWLVEPESMLPWPNTDSALPWDGGTGSGSPLTHLDVVWGENVPFRGGWQLMTTVLPPGLLSRARAQGHRTGIARLNFTLAAIIWRDLYGHRMATPSRGIYRAFSHSEPYFELPALPALAGNVDNDEAAAAAAAGEGFTQHKGLAPTDLHNFSRSMSKAGLPACEASCEATNCTGFTMDPLVPLHQRGSMSPGDGSCWLYSDVVSLSRRSVGVWWQSGRAALPPIIGPPPPSPPHPPAPVLDDQAYLQAQALQDVNLARAAQNFGPAFDAAVAAGHVPAWVNGSLGGGHCRRPLWSWDANQLHGQQRHNPSATVGFCSEGEWRVALAAESVRNGLRQIELIGRAGTGEAAAVASGVAARTAWQLPANATADWVGRLTAALDFWTRSQGANGGWSRPLGWPAGHKSAPWIGAPDRTNSTGEVSGFRSCSCGCVSDAVSCGCVSGGMEGIGTAAIGKCFLLLAGRAGGAGHLTKAMLAQSIDDDSDPSTPQVPRRQAYITMFKRGIDFWLDTESAPFSVDPPLPVMWNWGGPGNQGLDNMHSFYLQYLSLRWLAPAMSDAETGVTANGAKNMLMMGVGLSLSLQKGPLSTSSCASVSPAGISMEGAPGLHHGGYMEGYGQIAGHQFRVNRDLCDHDPQGCDPAMIVQAKRVSDAFGRFRRVASCQSCGDVNSGDAGGDFPCLIAEPHISWRHLLSPGPVTYGDFDVGAAVFGDRTAQRLFELFTEHEVLLRAQNTTAEQNCLRRDNLFGRQDYSIDPTRALVFAQLYGALLARPPAPPLPTELAASTTARGAASSAWVDPVSATVVVHGPVQLYASLHWRSYTASAPGSPPCSAAVQCPPILSNVTRLHYSNAENDDQGGAVDRVATVAAWASDGQDSLYASDYGVFAIAICGYRCLGSTGVYHPPPRFVGRACTDLASGRRFERLPTTLALVPLESLVLMIT